MHRLPRAFRLQQARQLVQPRILHHIPQRRFQSQIVYKTNGEPLRYQRVRFDKSRMTPRRSLRNLLYATTFLTFSILIRKYAPIEVVEVPEGSEKQGAVIDEDDDDELDEDSLFIPMTWATKMPRTFYKGSDPEWQEFVKIAKDKERHKKIQNELVQIVFSSSQQHPAIKQQLGPQAKVGKYWLDISFPDGPPQEYERSGLEFGDGYIAWSRERIDPETQWRLTRALWPKATFDSLWAASKVLFGINYRRAMQALGWSEADPFSPEERYRHAMEMMEKQSQAKQMGKAQLDPNGPAIRASSASSAQPSRSNGDDGKRLPWQIPVPMPDLASANSNDVPIAMLVFRGQLSKQWNPKKMEPPRGTFVVQGLVEIRGSRGRMLFDVRSCYDPKAGKYTNIDAGVRNFKRWNQAPRGGP